MRTARLREARTTECKRNHQHGRKSGFEKSGFEKSGSEKSCSENSCYKCHGNSYSMKIFVWRERKSGRDVVPGCGKPARLQELLLRRELSRVRCAQNGSRWHITDVPAHFAKVGRLE